MKHRLAKRIWLTVAIGIVVATVGLVAGSWHASLLPGEIDPGNMGYPDYGVVPGGDAHAGHDTSGGGHGGMHGAAGVSVDSLVEQRQGEPDRRITLTARAEGDRITLNGRTPGPELRFAYGELVEVVLVNESVSTGATLHWHGLDVPNAVDGVAGVTQDAVMPGERFVYRFVADQPGTYWYHAHQLSSEQVRKGLLGALVVEDPPAAGGAPAEGAAPQPVTAELDQLVVLHQYGAEATLNGAAGTTTVPAETGQTVRVRVVNTDNALTALWATAPYRVVASDGSPLNDPEPVTGRSLGITAGGRADLLLTVPQGGARIDFGGTTALVLGSDPSAGAVPPQPTEFVDLLSYGSPADTGLDASRPDRSFEYRIGKRLGFLDGRPGTWWTINDRLYPDVPMFMVEEGELVTMRIENQSGDSHPMHLHGHHALVLSRNGTPSTGSPWWVDSIEVAPGDTWEIAFRADNPGIWMDHCHNLPHASEGLVAHLMYTGVTSPYRIGSHPGNHPE